MHGVNFGRVADLPVLFLTRGATIVVGSLASRTTRNLGYGGIARTIRNNRRIGY
jgi:hypothetical protein